MMLSICIPTYDRANLLRETLEHLTSIQWPFDTEVVVSIDGEARGDVKREAVAFPVRAILQDARLEPIDNHFAALRAAKGKYAFFLGDDDAVIPDALVRAVEEMERRPKWIACFSPYEETEQGTDRHVGFANVVPSAIEFGKGDFFGALNFFLAQMYHPETPLVRSDAFRRFVTRPRKIWYGYWLFSCLLKQGDIGILTEPVWKHRLRPVLDDKPQLQWQLAVDEMDRNRLGLEYIALLAAKQQGGMTNELANTLVTGMVKRFSDYAHVASHICQRAGDDQAAVEFLVRMGLWQNADFAAVDAESIERRVDAEIEKRRATTDGELIVVDTSTARLAMVQAGKIDPARVVAREDLKLALRLT